MRAIFLASGEGTTFEACVKQCQHIVPVGMFTNNRNAGAIRRAKELDMFRIIFNNPLVTCKEDRDYHLNACIASQLRFLQPDIIVLAGYMKMIPETLVMSYRDKIVNVHPSLLPKYPGLNTFRRALDAGGKYHGTTIHFVDEGMDTGPIIAQARFEISKDDTEDTLKEKTQNEERKLYPLVLDAIATGEITIKDGVVKKRHPENFPTFND